MITLYADILPASPRHADRCHNTGRWSDFQRPSPTSRTPEHWADFYSTTN